MSRTYRFIRFRVTAHPIFLLTVIPSLATSYSFVRHTTRIPRLAKLFGEFANRRNSDRLRRRIADGNE